MEKFCYGVISECRFRVRDVAFSDAEVVSESRAFHEDGRGRVHQSQGERPAAGRAACFGRSRGLLRALVVTIATISPGTEINL
jgi:hypothetical protein